MVRSQYFDVERDAVPVTERIFDGNLLFRQLSKDHINAEQKRHDLALEKLARAKQDFEQ